MEFKDTVGHFLKSASKHGLFALAMAGVSFISVGSEGHTAAQQHQMDKLDSESPHVFSIYTSSSPIAPPEEKLGVYVVDQGQGLDTGCTFSSGGPLVIQLDVPQVVNSTVLDNQGYLLDPGKLVGNGMLGATATLSLPVYDIDSSANIPGVNPEVDDLYFNGRFKKTLIGQDSQWTDDVISIPIEEIKFGQINEIKIDIDTANAADNWCMSVDWVAIEFEVAAPYVLAHGISADSSTWDDDAATGVLAYLDEQGILYDRFSLVANGTSAGNAALLQGHIRDFLEPLKADKVHIIAHSKGGLDSQALQALAPPFDILSLSTLSTPHLGSVAADLSIIQKTSANRYQNIGDDPNGYAAKYVNTWTFGQGPQNPGLGDLTTQRALQAIASGVRGNISKTFTIGADADLNGDNDLTTNESAGLFPGIAHYGAERAWRVLRDFSSAHTVEIVTKRLPARPKRRSRTITILKYAATSTIQAQNNDIVVTLNSANPSYGQAIGNVMANHSTLKNAQNITRIVNNTIHLK